MEGVIFCCPPAWRKLLPPGVLGAERAEALAEQYWPLLVLTRRGCGELGDTAALCRVLLVPGDCTAPLERITAETVVTYGLSSRDSLTLSSLAEPVLCVQRQLPRPGGGVVEPQEFPLPELPAPAAELLPLLGLRLLQLPQTSAPFVCRLKTKRGAATWRGMRFWRRGSFWRALRFTVGRRTAGRADLPAASAVASAWRTASAF